MRQLLIGTSDFQRFIEEDGYFVDKSLFIKEVIENPILVHFITRPRRFGKTLNMTMLKAFFEQTLEKTSHLFKGLEIEKYESIMAYQGTFPVIYLTFKDVKFSKWDFTKNSIYDIIRDQYQQHKYLLNSVELDEHEKNYIIDMLNGNLSEYLYYHSLNKLTYLLNKHYKKRVILLVDEYDTPIHSAYVHGYYEEMIELMRSLLGGALKDNSSLEKAVITGILRVGKESIFSGLNNLTTNTLVDYRFQDSFGFTEDEVVNILTHYSTRMGIDDVRAWYNGYVFGETIIYNPWSISNYVLNERRGLMAHWVNTSDNELIEDLFRKGNRVIKIGIEHLMSGQSIERKIKEGVSLRDLEHNPESIWSFLLFSGYLKSIESEYRETGLWAKLMIPNKEVMYLYKEIISKWTSKTMSNSGFEEMLQALLNGNVTDFSKFFKNYVKNSMSYFDISGDESEKVYHAFVLGMLVSLSETHKVKSNRESGLGRYDVMLIPRNQNDYGVIFEFKKYDESDEKSIEQAAENAFTQIKRKNYKQELMDEGVENILEIGVAFKGKEVKLKWE